MPARDQGGLSIITRFSRHALFRTVVVTSVVGALLSLAGAFGTDYLPVAGRMAFWVGLCDVGALLGYGLSVYGLPPRWRDERPALSWALLVAMISVTMSGVVTLSIVLIRGRPIGAALVTDIFPQTLMTTAALSALALLLRPRPLEETHAAPPPTTGTGPRPEAAFLRRLPERLREAELWAVEADDHYLRVHTDRGADLILMRLADAVAELEGLEGARTHRSWWVAREAVVSAERADGRATLTLKGGIQAPVSRAYAPGLRAAGWF